MLRDFSFLSSPTHIHRIFPHAVDKAEDGPFYHHIVLELVEVEALPPVWSADEVRQKFSTRFKMEGNKKFSEGDYFRSVNVLCCSVEMREKRTECPFHSSCFLIRWVARSRAISQTYLALINVESLRITEICCTHLTHFHSHKRFLG